MSKQKLSVDGYDKFVEDLNGILKDNFEFVSLITTFTVDQQLVDKGWINS